MNLEQFDELYAKYKSTDKIEIPCDHPDHEGPNPTLGKQPARRNILKRGGEEFICRQCCMKHENPMTKVGQGRQTDEIITVVCSHPEHKESRERRMKKSCFYGKLVEPYEQICGSCAQLGKVISEEQKQAISEKLTGRKLSDEHVKKILVWREANPEWAEKANKNLIPGMGGIARAGQPLPEEWKQAISEGTKGKPKTEEHCQNISEGRKKMLAEQGGFTREHRENISKATIRQYQNGFEPKLHHLRGWHESPKAGKVYYRSSYEKKAFMKLDEDDSVKTYQVEAVSTEYFHPLKEITSSYLIDLLVEFVDGSQKLIEVKPEKWLTDEVVVAKIEAGEMKAEDMRLPFEVWTEMDLFGHVYNEKNMRRFVEKVKKGLV